MAIKLLGPDGSPILIRGEEVWVSDVVGKVKSVDVENRRMRIVGTDETKDRDGDIIRVKGWELDNYKKNPVFLWAHDYRSVPIARAEKLIKRKDPLRYEFHLLYPTENLFPFSDMILSLYGEKMINASSVGFIPKKWEKIEPEEEERRRAVKDAEGKLLFWHEPREYVLQELLELSGCPVPSNPNALTPDALGQRSFGGILASEMLQWIQESKIPEPENIDDILEEIECTPLILEDETKFSLQVPEGYEVRTSHDPPKLKRRVTGKEPEEEVGEGEEELPVYYPSLPKPEEKVEDVEFFGPFEIEFEESEFIEVQDVLKPFPNEHACRLKPPNYPKYARRNCFRKIDGKCVDFIFGIKGPKKSELQSMRFKKNSWTAAAARKVCSDRGGSFEAAGSSTVSFDLEFGNLEEGKFYIARTKEKLPDADFARVAEQLKTFGDSNDIRFLLVSPDFDLSLLELLEMSPEKAKQLLKFSTLLVDAMFPAEEPAGQAEANDPSEPSEAREDHASTILSEAFQGEGTRSQKPESPSLQDRLHSPGGQELMREMRSLSKILNDFVNRR